ncbi:flagellar biosynthetic protein FliR [Solimicrobium silvestre]|uniref:Flagellar biosynthetic protein FliR n=1 Tax=Solimicrobium silvestre TaxID=2099400 RepID=A0A2S9GSU3_9BURK|nr:flagellar biosynthetic protein FliR [Solimicrobium silvestre]PRC90789.1 fliR: flagellar biosynthetic protein FliR [Solimicrobium silvestre]
MLSISSDQLIIWVNSFIWPLTRILGLIAIAPIFGNAAIPVPMKISFGVVLALLVAPTLHNLPLIDPISLPGMLILIEQFVIGVAMGFTIQVVFGSVDLAGNLIGMSMGLGFASFFDPQTRGNTPAISQFLTLVTTMLFLSLNLHLALLSTLVESFTKLPIGVDLTLQPGIWLHIVSAASVIFSSGVQLALPIIAALLVTNIALGILTRAAPQLNIFGIGFPITMTVGFLMLFIIIPYLALPLQKILEFGIQLAALR